VTLPENSPSKVPAIEKPLSHFISALALTSAESASTLAPFTTTLVPGKVWNSAVTARLGPFALSSGPFRVQFQRSWLLGNIFMCCNTPRPEARDCSRVWDHIGAG